MASSLEAVFEVLRVEIGEETKAVFEGSEIGSSEDEKAFWFEDTVDFGKKVIGVEEMFDNLEGEDEVEGVISEWEGFV